MSGFAGSFEIVDNALATPTRITGVPGELAGCIYRADGSKVEISERFGGHHGDLMRTNNPPRPELASPPMRLSGKGLYLGHFMGGHYGHFITETLSSFWILQMLGAASFDYVLFHPFIFGLDQPEYSRYCLARFGITPDRVVFVGAEGVCCEELTVPERLLRLNHSADPRLRWVYGEITRDAPLREGQPIQLYLSRRRFSRRNFDRVVANEVLVESAFRARGFSIVYPETMSFIDQIGLYRHAEVVAGQSGSGLHNAVFMREGARLIELGDPRYGGAPAPTQQLCNGIAGVDADFIPFDGRIYGRRSTMLLDVDALEKALDRKGWVMQPGYSGLPRSLAWAAGLPEIAYLSIRPGAGELARRLLKPRARAPVGAAH